MQIGTSPSVALEWSVDNAAWALRTRVTLTALGALRTEVTSTARRALRTRVTLTARRAGTTIGSARVAFYSLGRREAEVAGSFEKLEDAGLIVAGSVPQAHRDVLDDLSDEEVSVILDVAARLAEADQDEGLVGSPAFTRYFTF